MTLSDGTRDHTPARTRTVCMRDHTCATARVSAARDFGEIVEPHGDLTIVV